MFLEKCSLKSHVYVAFVPFETHTVHQNASVPLTNQFDELDDVLADFDAAVRAHRE